MTKMRTREVKTAHGIELKNGWADSGSRVNPSPRPAIFYLPPTLYPLRKTIIHFHSPQERGKLCLAHSQSYSSTFPTTWKKQGCLSTPCPSNSTASCFSKSKLSWVRLDLHFQLPLKTTAGQWGRGGQASPTGDSRFLCLQKKEGRS